MRNVIILLAAGTLSWVMSACGGDSSADKARIAKLEAQIEELKRNGNNTETVSNTTQQEIAAPATSYEEPAPVSNTNHCSLVGKYRIMDDRGEWLLIVNSDGTCQFQNNGTIYYGTWKESYDGSAYNIDMSDSVHFYLQGKRVFFIPRIDTDCEWMYDNSSSLKARNPNKRLRLERIG